VRDFLIRGRGRGSCILTCYSGDGGARGSSNWPPPELAPSALVNFRDQTTTSSSPFCAPVERAALLCTGAIRGGGRALLWRTINYGVRARREAFQKLFNCLRGIAGQKYKGMIYIRSCFLCIECSRCRARAAEEMERARRTCPRPCRFLDLASHYGDFQYLTELTPDREGNGRS